MEFNVANIQGLLGEGYICGEKGPNRNVKVDLARLVNRNAANLSDDDKIDLLVEAREKIRAAGLECTLRLTQRDRNGTYKPWPHMWVNHNVQARGQAAQELAAENRALLKIIEKLGGSQALAAITTAAAAESTTETVNETPESTPVDADGDGFESENGEEVVY